MKSPALLTASLLAMIFSPFQTAKASDIGLDFSLPGASQPSGATPTEAPLPPPDPESPLPPLPIPTQAAHPPVTVSTLPPPATVFNGGAPFAIAATPSFRGLSATLPPPPPAIDPPEAVKPVAKPGLIALHFDLDNPPLFHTPDPSAREDNNTNQAHVPISNPVLFQGGVDSLVAKAIGSAEGTRTPEGHRTQAYYGHIDPGNRAWNLGTFSYQHGALTPEDADERQLKRLQTQTQLLDQKANTHGLTLTLEEKLNAIDLANQAPRAALGRGGYLEWLSEAHRLGMTGADAILWSRTRAFLDPDTQRWNAPGLGNTVSSISRDQERRMKAIARTMDIHQPQPAPVMAAKPEIGSSQTPQQVSQENSISPPKPKGEAADIIFSVSLQQPTKPPQSSSQLHLAAPRLAPLLSPASPPAIRLQSSPPEASVVLPASPLENQFKRPQTREKPVEFPAFPNLEPIPQPTFEQVRVPAPISDADKIDQWLLTQALSTQHEPNQTLNLTK